MHILSQILIVPFLLIEVQSSLSIHQRLALGPTPDISKSWIFNSQQVAMCICYSSDSTYHEHPNYCMYLFTGKKSCISGLLQFKPVDKVSCIQFDVESWLHQHVVLIPLLFGPRSSSTIIGPSFLHFSSSKFWFLSLPVTSLHSLFPSSLWFSRLRKTSFLLD